MGDRTLSMTYMAVHQRIRAKRGVARAHKCIAPDCEKQAGTWAWQHTGPFIEAEPTEYVKARQWGTRIEDYEPMCYVHAGQLDRGGTLTHCPAGHLRTPENTYTNPARHYAECLTCKRDARAARNARKIKKTCAECGAQITEQNHAAHVRDLHRERKSA